MFFTFLKSDGGRGCTGKVEEENHPLLVRGQVAGFENAKRYKSPLLPE
jgi:hypothetical protein